MGLSINEFLTAKFEILWLVKGPGLEKIYPSGWKIGSLRCKNSQALLFLERIFLFLDLDCQNLATLGFDNCPISEKKNSLSEKKLRLRVFPSQSNLFPAARNYYSFQTVEKLHFRDRHQDIPREKIRH